MACRGCTEVPAMTKDQVVNYINKLIKDGELQAGLTDCKGKRLRQDTAVLTCEGNKFVTDVTVDGGKLKVTYTDGKTDTLDLPGVTDLAYKNGVFTWKEGGNAHTATLDFLSEVHTNSPIQGDGTKKNPLVLNTDTKYFVVNPATGVLTLTGLVTTDEFEKLEKRVKALENALANFAKLDNIADGTVGYIKPQE